MPLERQDATFLFEVVSKRYEALKSITLTSNKSYGTWNEILPIRCWPPRSWIACYTTPPPSTSGGTATGCGILARPDSPPGKPLVNRKEKTCADRIQPRGVEKCPILNRWNCQL